ncbi:MAG TPA: hypothetical protein V6C86_04860 [Oculatellaceae cyanobacterium]
MHGGFGGGHGGGGGGFGHGGGGHHSSGGHHSGSGHQTGHSHSQPIAVHNLGGGGNQSIIGHMTSLVTNGHGVLGHIAGWLTGQHHSVMHHASNGQNHIGDAQWASAALQVEKSSVWQKVTKIPGIQVIGVFLVIAGWLLFLGMLRHGDGEHTARSPMATQQEWRQELVGDSHAPEAAGAPDAASEEVAQGGFAGGSLFGAPRAGFEDASQVSMPAQANNQTVAAGYVPQAQSAMQAQSAPNLRSLAQSDELLNAHAIGATPIQMQPAQMQSAQQGYRNPNMAVGGRRSFTARGNMVQDFDAAAIASGRAFHHRVVAER